MFADDLVIFSKADPTSLHLIMEALQSFHATAGLKANLQKSQIVIGGASQSLHQNSLQATQLQDSHLPVTYLVSPY